jgi:hypothetical protein
MQKKSRNNFKNNKIFFFRKNNSRYLKNVKKKNEIKDEILNNQKYYLYKNKKLKKGIFLKRPRFNEIMYPFYLNLKLVNEYLKKK